MIAIKDISGKIRLSVSIEQGSVHRFELMKEDYISLVFSLETPVQFEIGDNIDYEGSSYYITDKVYPSFNTSNGGYDYTIRFDSHYYRWKNHILFYDRQGNKEASWSLTRAPEAQLGIVISNLRTIGFTFNGKNYQAVVDSSVNAIAKLVQYDNTNIIDALTKIAETWECEWWVDEDKIYLGRMEHGEPIDLEIGKEISSISRSQSQDVFATRLYAFGSTRNIPSDYRKGEEGTVVESVVQKRLMLPEGTPYVDVVEGLDEKQIIEAVVIFDDIYPRITGTITQVAPKEVSDTDETGKPVKFTVYRFKDANLTFSESYILPGQELHVIFQTGPLSGMDFALEFNPEKLPENNPEAQVFEIVRNDTYGQTLPESPLIPGVGDKYVLYNFDTRYVSDTLIPQAEQELLKRVNEYKDKVVSDPSTYTCNLNSYKASGYDENNGLLNPEKAINLSKGQKVNLINKAYFASGRVSRVIGFTKNIDIPYDSPSYTIGESSAYSRLGELEQKLENIQYKDNTYVNQGGGSGVYIIKKEDTTAASDENVFSALKTLDEIDKTRRDFDKKFLRKDAPDTAHEAILFDDKIGSSVFIDGWEGKGWEIKTNGAAIFEAANIRSNLFVGNKIGSQSFTPGLAGWGTDIDMPSATITTDNLYLRKNFFANTITYSQVYAVGGSQVVSDVNKIESVERLSDRWRCYIDRMDGLMKVHLRVGDGARIRSDVGVSLVKSLFGRVIEIGSTYLDIAYPMLDGVGEPAPGDFVTRWGNNVDATRQGLIYSTTSDPGAPFTSVYDGITDITTQDKLKVQFGNISGIRLKNGRQLSGYGAYLNGIWIENSQIFLENGDTIEQNFFAMNGKFESEIEAIKNDMSVDSGNILVNSSFAKDLKYWTLSNDVHFINTPTGYLWMDGYFYVEKNKVADIYQDGGKNVLRIKDSSISQLNGVIKTPERKETSEDGYVYSFAFYYKVIRPGTLSVGIPGTDLYIEQEMETSEDYEKLSKVAHWNEKGDFLLKFTGGEILIYGVSLFNDALADAQVHLQTQITQNAEAIKLMATKEYVDSETGKIYTEYNGELKVANDRIDATVTKVDNINNRIDTAGWITEADGNTLFAAKSLEDGDKIISYINQSATTTTISSSRINLIGAVTFQMFDSSLQNTIDGKLTGSSESGNNKLNSVIINGQTLIAGGYIQANLIKADEIFTTTLLANTIKAYGLNINDKFIVDKEGFVDMQGKFTASYNGNKIIINPSSNGAKITGVDSNGRTVMNIGFSYYEGVNAPLIEMTYYNSSGQEMGSTRIAPDGASFRSRLNTGGMSTMTIGRSSKGLGMTINATFPTYAQASYGDLYVDGDDVVRIRQEW